MRRIFSSIMVGIFLFYSITTFYSCSDNKIISPDPEPLVQTENTTSSVDLDEIGIETVTVYSAWDEPKNIATTDVFDIKVSVDAPQIVFAMDDTLGIRAIGLHLPSFQGSSVSNELRTAQEKVTSNIEIDALSTLKALLSLTPGLYSDDPLMLGDRLNAAMQTTEFEASLDHLRSNLQTRPLSEIVQDEDFQSVFSACIQQTSQLVLKSETGSLGSTFLKVEVVDDSDLTNVKAMLTNSAYRYVELYRQQFDESRELISTHEVAVGRDCMKSAVPVNWGSIFTNTVSDNSYFYDHIDMTGGTCLVRYWAIGPGFSAGGGELPQEINSSHLWPWGRSIFDFVVGPIASLFLGIKYSDWQGWSEAREVIEAAFSGVKVANGIMECRDANTALEQKRAVINVTVALISVIAIFNSTTALGAAIVKAAPFIAAATAGLSIANLIVATAYWSLAYRVSDIVLNGTPCVEETGTIIIDQTPDFLAGAGWTLTGPQNESGSGDATLADMPTGPYTITWDAVSGYITPTSAPQTLVPDGTITFSGTYAVDPGPSGDFVYIPPGTFTMGSPTNEPGRIAERETQHQVTLTKGFYISKYKVTEQWWYEVMGGTPTTSQLPKNHVSWDMAVTFCNALSDKEGLTPAYTINGPDGDVTWNRSANGYRLPTEAEWEYACRAMTTMAFNNNTNCLSSDTEANYDGRYPLTGCPSGVYRGARTEVGTFPKNNWDLYDMHGNLWHWVWDGYRSDYENLGSVDPVYDVGPGADRVRRGGSGGNVAQVCRSASRSYDDPGRTYLNLGLRPVRSAD